MKIRLGSIVHLYGSGYSFGECLAEVSNVSKGIRDVFNAVIIDAEQNDAYFNENTVNTRWSMCCNDGWNYPVCSIIEVVEY